MLKHRLSSDDLENDYEDVVEELKELNESIDRLRNLPERNEAQEKLLERDEDMRETLPNSKKSPILSEMGFIDAYVEIHNENRKRIQSRGNLPFPHQQ